METRYLFMGKRIDNGEWVEGDLVHSLYKLGDTCVGQYGNEVGMHIVDPATVCQCTGLRDKERLTERFENGQVGTLGCGNNCKYNYRYCDNALENCPTIAKVFEKLAVYEDAEAKLEEMESSHE